MKVIKNIFPLLIFILLLSCEKEEAGPQRDNTGGGNGNFDEGLFIVNEGNFGSNNSSLSHLNLLSNTISNDIYAAANEEKRLGDVLQSMTIEGNRTYLLVNNSKKIEVVQSATLKKIATISGLNSPRFMQQVTPEKAYVSNFTLSDNGSLQVVDLLNENVSGNIEMNGWTEQMLFLNQKLWVCNMTRGSVQIVDPNTEVITSELDLAAEPNSIVKDANGMLWVLCSGGFEKELPALFNINTSTFEVKKYDLNFTLKDSPSNLCINQSKDSLYFLNADVYKMAVNNPGGKVVKVVDLTNFQYPYGLYVYGDDNEVFVTEAYDFQRDGKLFRYSSSGKLIRQFTLGEGPSFMYVEGN